mmetsp:Transcript_19783/g.35892  ORF Transcript_19783/g.35892 Transcript_19783/m.35892 type:complete len:201 (-) Transcript_19783:547-1149(-)
MLVGILDTVLVGKEVWCITAMHELSHVIPPFHSDAISLTIVLPDADTTKALSNDIRSRCTLFKIVIGVGSTVSSVICTEVEAHIFTISTLAVGFYSIIDVHMRREIGTITQCNGDFFKVFLEFLAHTIARDCPKIVFYPIIRTGQFPRHLHLNHVVRTNLCLDSIGILFKHQESGNRNITTRPIICHNWFRSLANIFSIR